MRTLLTTLHSKYIHPSLALPCLAVFCGQECGEIQIEEFTIHQPKENILAAILSQEPDVVCFSVYIWNRQLTLELISVLKVAAPFLRVVLGGPEVSFEEASFFRSCPADAIICGEGEVPLKALLHAWQLAEDPPESKGLQLPGMGFCDAGRASLEDLDLLPSPFNAGLVDLQRGYVYYESSRGCPYNCSFCMSALDDKVRSFSMERIYQDLGLLMREQVAQIKFVDRTFNYHAKRSRKIIRYILENNRSSRFHFEIGADLLDEPTLALLETVPPGMFQFEVGVQTTNNKTLGQIERQTSLDKLENNVRRLLRAGNIHLHLDLIAGLPGETFDDFFVSLRQVLNLEPQHLQIELVKLLPGAPLRFQAEDLGLEFDPFPPYTVLRTSDLKFRELEVLRGIGRLLDLLNNSGRFLHFLRVTETVFGDQIIFYRELQSWWQEAGLFNEPVSLAQQFDAIAEFINSQHEPLRLREALARDFALVGRVVPGKAPAFFNCILSPEQQLRVKGKVKQELENLKAGEKLQHFAALFETVTPADSPSLLLYLYRSQNGKSPRVEEIFL